LENRRSELLWTQYFHVVFTLPEPIAAIAYQNKFAIRPGPMMAGGAFFDITLTGKGSHGARPEDGIDPVLTACHVTTALQAIVSRNIRPADTAVLSVTTIQAGEAYNVIPQTAVIRGTFRTFSNETMKQIEDCMRRIASGVAAAAGRLRAIQQRPYGRRHRDAWWKGDQASTCLWIVSPPSKPVPFVQPFASEGRASRLGDVPTRAARTASLSEQGRQWR
jgi:acetylornithine deacetylase/succinyl-diaminopimelate desuccinylase-like protein